jgi:UDP-N-acetylmuramate: L-alanyl-gamma-D-glutamyl-meso-diaminopimelate ligase
VLDRKLPYASLPEVLREIFLNGRETIAVTGTHGKTTVTALLSWIFFTAGLDPGFLIGGVPMDFPRGFRRGGGKFFIIEGDEYDTAFFDKGPKFLHYRPDAAVLTSIEFDHADIYRDLEEVTRAFQRLINLIPGRGYLSVTAESPVVGGLLDRAFCTVESFGIEEGDWRAMDIQSWNEGTSFQVVHGGQSLGRLVCKMAGVHNVRNILSALAVAVHYGLAWGEIREAVATFRGVKRRMEIAGKSADIVVVDDFAHHPTAIRETIRAIRLRFPERRIWAVLEPRSHTLRRNIFASQIVESLAEADRVVLAEVFRQDRIPVSEQLDLAHVQAGVIERGIPAIIGGGAHQIVELMLPDLAAGDCILVMSNGGFGGIHQLLLESIGSGMVPAR